MRYKLPSLHPGRKGFTLIETMLVTAIIGLIASIAIPAWQRARKRAQADVLMNELRVTADAFQTYVAEKGGLPPTASGFSAVPTGMLNYLPRKSTWTSVAPTGGYWYWWNFSSSEVWGFTGLIGVYNPNFDADQQLAIDSTMDDGDGNAGGVHTQSGWVFLGVK